MVENKILFGDFAGRRWPAAVHAGAGGYVSMLSFSFRTRSLDAYIY